MSTKNENLTHVCDTLYNHIDNYEDYANQLHNYAIKDTDEYWRLKSLIENGKGENICEELGFHSDKRTVEGFPGKTFTEYFSEIVGDFLIIQEYIAMDV